MDQAVNTKFLVFSVTHADGRITEKLLDIETRVDVAIHCGDLTEESKLDEYRSALHLLKGVNAHLKLVIAGNHDWALDKPTYEHHAAEYQRLYEEDPELFARTYVYASPYTCSPQASWGFQYTPAEEHEWLIPTTGVDIVMIHSPPRGIHDRINKEKRDDSSPPRAGSLSLFSAIAKTKPKVHCFGHIHESWGARKVAWRDDLDDADQALTHFTAIDNGALETMQSLQKLAEQEHRDSITCELDATLEPGQQTLFINAAVEELDKERPQPAILVEIPLSKAESEPTEKPETKTSKRRRDDDDQNDEDEERPTKRIC